MRIIDKEDCKRIQISILTEIDRLCKVYGIDYYIQYGTLLGAVRHKGFIPWDDDIDIIMERKNYERLVELMKTGKNQPGWLQILDSSVEGYYYPFAKAVDARTVAEMESNTTKHGIWVDIFPIDNVPDDEKKADVYIDFCCALRETVIAMTTNFKSSRKNKEHALRQRVLWLIATVVGKKNVCRMYEKVCRKYEGTDTKCVANLFSPYRRREKFERSVLFCSAEYPFEDTVFVGPKHYDSVLTQLYGKYMVLPPEDKRRTHGVLAWYID